MVTRKNVLTLTDNEKANLVNGIKQLKAQGRYDWYVQTHNDVTQHTTPNGSNAAHMGPAFLPWHRKFLLLLEKDLQQVLGDSSFGLPYWDWANDAALPDPKQSAIWANNLMGGQGSPVTTGPFAAGQWTLWPSGSLVRNFGQGTPTLPTQTDVDNVLTVTPYDASPWNTSSNPSFRNQLEGWLNGPQLHNRVHVWVGGSMLPMTSPNDPVFFLHHCNIDRIWAMWQADNPGAYLPITGGPQGHNLNDLMWPWDGTTAPPTLATPAMVLDYSALGYSYGPPVEISGTFQISQTVTYQGNPSYQLDTNYQPLIMSGGMSSAGSISFYVRVPQWNPNSKCGSTQDKTANIWIKLNGQELMNFRVSNWHVTATNWKLVGPIPLNQGSFVLQVESGEGDGCGWPDNTDPYYLSGITLS
jgi:tyrosinase